MTRNVPVIALVVLASTLYGAVNGEVENPCEKGIDLGIIVDRSKSVRKDNYIKMKGAVKNFLNSFNITPETTHASLILFADEANHLFNLSDSAYHSNEAIDKKISSISNKLIFGTRTDLALMKAHDELFNAGHDRKRYPNVLLVLTDGQTSSKSAPYSETVPPLEDKGVKIIAVGIGSKIKKEELKKISGQRGTVVQVSDFDALAGKLNEILAEVCIINGGYTSWSGWSECSVTCGNGTKTRSRNCTNPEPMGGGANCDEIGLPEEREACELPACDESINGGYTRWTSWTQCDRTCGGGIQIRFRSCTNPAPYGNGKTCDDIGEPQETVACNTKQCKKEPTPCEQGLDLAILIDRSNSIRKRNVERLLKVFFPKFFLKFQISKKKTHIGIIMYHKEPEVLASLNGRNSKSRRKATSFVKKLSPDVSHHTRTDRGLEAVKNVVFKKKNGDRSSRQNVLLTFTDGRAYPRKRIKPFTETVPPLKQVKKCHMVAVGYGLPRKYNMTQLQEIAGDNVITIRRPNKIASKRIVNKIKRMVCEVDGGYTQWSMWSLCSTTCGAGVKVRSRVCNAPSPRGGKDCTRLGNSHETVECNEGECPTEPTPCAKQKLDVCIVVDQSLSVGVANFVRVKTFLTQFIYQFEPDTHFSVITFAKHPNVRCKFSDGQCQTADGTHDLISEIEDRLYWGTMTGTALITANQTVYTPENGDRADASNVVVIVTDGRTMKRDVPFSVIIPSMQNRTKILAFGVGPSIREEDLNEMAGEKNWFYVDNFLNMKERMPDILKTACNETTAVA